VTPGNSPAWRALTAEGDDDVLSLDVSMAHFERGLHCWARTTFVPGAS
jgi:hypothetical protein